VQKFDVITGVQAKAPPGPPSYTGVFADALCSPKRRATTTICAITAAMPSGTGLDKFGKAYPGAQLRRRHRRAACRDLRRRALRRKAMRPFCAIYSTFLQRAYDQVVHDVAIQNLPVRFAIDRAGLVGADGATHAGSFDVTYLATLAEHGGDGRRRRGRAGPYGRTPAALHDSRPDRGALSARQRHVGVALPETPETLEIGKGRIVREGKTVAILSLGTRLGEALKAADAARGARACRPRSPTCAS
jgi:1-deoxy-D-xylulose-5-phosphate synthase